MGRTSDRDRILGVLSDSPDGLSNARIKDELSLTDDRYETVRSQLIDEGLAEKYVCRGGGLRLTPAGERQFRAPDDVGSSVNEEKDLYAHLIDALKTDVPEDIIFDTSRLRKRGKWQNPDVTQITLEVYPRLQKTKVVVTAYEVKQYGRWDVGAVFEAASQARFTNAGYIVLEWPHRQTFRLSDSRVDQIVRECQRFGVGLVTLTPYYTKYRAVTQLEPIPREPLDADVENWLDYALTRRKSARAEYAAALVAARRALATTAASPP